MPLKLSHAFTMQYGIANLLKLLYGIVNCVILQYCNSEHPNSRWYLLRLHVRPEEVRHACTNHYKFSALMSLRSCDNVRMSDLL